MARSNKVTVGDKKKASSCRSRNGGARSRGCCAGGRIVGIWTAATKVSIPKATIHIRYFVLLSPLHGNDEIASDEEREQAKGQGRRLTISYQAKFDVGKNIKHASLNSIGGIGISKNDVPYKISFPSSDNVSSVWPCWIQSDLD